MIRNTSGWTISGCSWSGPRAQVWPAGERAVGVCEHRRFPRRGLGVGVEVEVEHALLGLEGDDLLGRAGWDRMVEVDVCRVGVAVVGADQRDARLDVHGR